MGVMPAQRIEREDGAYHMSTSSSAVCWKMSHPWRVVIRSIKCWSIDGAACCTLRLNFEREVPHSCTSFDTAFIGESILHGFLYSGGPTSDEISGSLCPLPSHRGDFGIYTNYVHVLGGVLYSRAQLCPPLASRQLLFTSATQELNKASMAISPGSSFLSEWTSHYCHHPLP